MNKKLFFIPAMAGLVLASCSNDEQGIVVSEKQSMKVTVALNAPGTRAMITDSYFGSGESIGLTVVDDGGTTYDGQDYSNIKFSSNGTVVDGTGQIWTSGTDVMLSATEGEVFGYYPWVDGADVAAIAMDVTSQTDYMYSSEKKGLSNSNPDCSLTMNHALAAIRVTLKNSATSPYTGEGAITGITLNSKGLGSKGTLNAKTRVTSVDESTLNSDLVALASGTDKLSAATADGYSYVYMVVPSSETADLTAESNNIDVTVVMDGNTFSNTVDLDTKSLKVEKGKIYTITLTAMSTGFEMGSDTNGDGVIDENDEPAVKVNTWEESTEVFEQDMNIKQ